MTNFEKMVKAAAEAVAVNEYRYSLLRDELELLRDELREPQAEDMVMDIACARCLEYGLGADDNGADLFTESFAAKLFELARADVTHGPTGNCGACGSCSAPTV